jgi:hypothetical protein
MDLSAVMAEVKTRTSAVSGLARTSIGFAGKINAPAAVVYPPDAVEFDGGYGRAADRYADLLVVVFVAAPTPDRGIAALAPYLSSAGAKSIKKALDSVITAYTSAIVGNRRPGPDRRGRAHRGRGLPRRYFPPDRRRSGHLGDRPWPTRLRTAS